MGAQVTLTAVSDEIRTLIESERHEDAIALCQHVLRYFPKHLDTYRQMAEATLQKGDLAGARDLFGRVLSADPENLVAYTGLATVFEKQHLLDEAYWHLERAHELAPADLDIRQELQRLSSELNRSRGRLKLTSAGLARLYAAQGLFTHAAREFRVISGNQPKRFDARVALAQVLWRAGRLSDAADVAQSLLRVLPFCLKGNLLLGMALQQSGVEEGEAHFQLAEALDPTNRVARDLFGAQSPLRLNDPGLPRYVSGPFPTAAGFGVGPEPNLEEADNWFLTGAAAAQPPALETNQPEEHSFPLATADVDSLGKAVSEAASETAVESPDTDEERTILPDWITQTFVADSSIATGEPAESGEPEAALLPPAEPAPSVPQEPTAPQEILAESEWTESLSSEPTMPPVTADASPADELPDWLSSQESAAEADSYNTSVPSSTPRPMPKPTAPLGSSLPPWLTEQQRTTLDMSDKTEEQPPPLPAAPLEVPAWLAEQPAQADAPLIAGEPAQAASAPEPEPAANVANAELPGWLGGTPLADQGPANEQSPLVAGTPAPPAPAVPDRMAESAPVGELPSSADETSIADEPDLTAPEKMPPPSLRRRHVAQANAKLELARAYLASNQINLALDEFAYVVANAPLLVTQVIPDLEQIVAAPDVPLKAHRILGDAYTRADRLAEALEQYRFVLDRVAE